MRIGSHIIAGLLVAVGMASGASAQQAPVRVAVIDSGIARTSTLDASIESEEDMVEGRRPFSTRSSHGTEVSTVLLRAAHRPVRIVSLRVDKDGQCDRNECRFDPTAIKAAVRRAIALRVDVINLSLDTPFDVQLYVLLRGATSMGIDVVMAAGNVPAEPHGLQYAKNIPDRFWLVGAKDGQGRPAEFSSRPKTDCGCRFVWRPGVDVATQARNGQPETVSGTSFSAPLLAAELADARGAAIVTTTLAAR